MDAVIKDLVDTVTKNDLEKAKSIFEENSSIIRDVVTKVNSKSSRKSSTNLLKCSANNKMAEYLIEKCISFSAAVTQAVKSGDLESVKLICQINSLIAKDELSQNPEPLKSATYDCKFNDKIARYLIEQGANPNETDHRGRYLLHLQILEGNFKGAKALVENGADVNLINQEVESYRTLIMGANQLEGETALGFAIRKYCGYFGYIDDQKSDETLKFISYLIEQKANLNIVDSAGFVPLDVAIFYNSLETVELLIKASADLNVGSEKAEGVLKHAITEGHIDIGKAAIRYILEHNLLWLNKPDLLNNQEDLSSYWDEYKAQVKELHGYSGK